MSADELLKLLMGALESGAEITITVRKPSPTIGLTTVKCPDCGWEKSFKRADNAVRSLRGHSKRCVKRKLRVSTDVPQWIIDQTREANGKNKT